MSPLTGHQVEPGTDTFSVPRVFCYRDTPKAALLGTCVADATWFPKSRLLKYPAPHHWGEMEIEWWLAEKAGWT